MKCKKCNTEMYIKKIEGKTATIVCPECNLEEIGTLVDYDGDIVEEVYGAYERYEDEILDASYGEPEEYEDTILDAAYAYEEDYNASLDDYYGYNEPEVGGDYVG